MLPLQLWSQLPSIPPLPDSLLYRVDNMDLHFYRSRVAFQHLELGEAARQLRAGVAPLGLLVGEGTAAEEEQLEALRKNLGIFAWELEAGKVNRLDRLSEMCAKVHGFLARYHFSRAEAAFADRALQPTGLAMEVAVQHLGHGLRYLEGKVTWELAPDLTAFEVAPGTYQGVVKTSHAMVRGLAFPVKEIEQALAYLRMKLRELENALAAPDLKD